MRKKKGLGGGEENKEENLIPTVLHTYSFCSPFKKKKKVYFTNLEEKNKKVKMATIYATSVTNRRTSFTQMGFGSGLMKVLSISPSPFMYLGIGLANITHCPAFYHISHIKEAVSNKELVCIHPDNAEKISPSSFSLPAAWARDLLGGCTARSQCCLAQLHFW